MVSLRSSEWSGTSEGDWCPRVFTWGFPLPFSPLPAPPDSRPPTPCNAVPELMHTRENIVGRTSKVNYILFIRLLNEVAIVPVARCTFTGLL